MLRVNKAFLAVAGAAVITAAFLSAWHRQRRNDRRRAAEAGRRVREIEAARREVAELEAMYASESAEEPW